MVTLENIRQAQVRLNSVVCHTPLTPFYDRNSKLAAWFKPENFQPVGSFKLRGAYNRMAAMSEGERSRWVIAYSTGNHAQGVAYAGQRLGIKTLIVMPDNAPSVKIEATQNYGAEVILFNPAREKHEDVTRKLMNERGGIYVHPSDDPYIIAGQGTIGLEIYEDLPETDLVLMPVGGGGLLSGVGASLKNLKSGVNIVGVEPELAADARASFTSGRIVEWPTSDTGRTIADGVRNPRIGELAFAHMQRYVDRMVAVTEDEIRSAMRHMILKSKLVIEPSAALPLAAYLYHRDELPKAENVVMILTGGNIDPALLKDIISEE